MLLLAGDDGRLINFVRFIPYVGTRTVRRRFHSTRTRRIAVVILHVSYRHVVVRDRGLLAPEHLVLLRYRLVTDRAHLHHALGTDGTRPGRRLQRLDEREVRFLLWIRTAVEETDAARWILQGTRVTDEGRGVDRRSLTFP